MLLYCVVIGQLCLDGWIDWLVINWCMWDDVRRSWWRTCIQVDGLEKAVSGDRKMRLQTARVTNGIMNAVGSMHHRGRVPARTFVPTLTVRRLVPMYRLLTLCCWSHFSLYATAFVCYLRRGSYVMPFVCLSVCLLAILRKNYRIDLRENFTTDVYVVKEELIKFRKSSASASG